MCTLPLRKDGILASGMRQPLSGSTIGGICFPTNLLCASAQIGDLGAEGSNLDTRALLRPLRDIARMR